MLYKNRGEKIFILREMLSLERFNRVDLVIRSRTSTIMQKSAYLQNRFDTASTAEHEPSKVWYKGRIRSYYHAWSRSLQPRERKKMKEHVLVQHSFLI